MVRKPHAQLITSALQNLQLLLLVLAVSGPMERQLKVHVFSSHQNLVRQVTIALVKEMKTRLFVLLERCALLAFLLLKIARKVT
jgi:hypothetical protein